MEAKFEVTSNLTQKQYVEVYRRFLGKRNIIAAIVSVIGALFLFCGILVSSNGLIFAGIFELLYAFWIYLLPWRRARKVFKENQKYEGTPYIFAKTTITDEQIIDESTRVTVKIPYDKIKKIYISDDLIVLSDIQDMGVVMARDGFTKGDFGQFMEFIRMKCPQLKLPQW